MLKDGDWLSVLRQQLTRQELAVLITVVRSQGHVPGEVGARMVVGRNWYADSIGGGWLEEQACQHARQLLTMTGSHHRCQHFELGLTPDCCLVGTANLLFELLDGQSLPWVEMALQARGQGRVLRRMVALESAEPVKYQLLQGAGEGIRLLRPTLLQDDLPAVALLVVLCGAGPVGREVSRLLGHLPCKVFWLDSRPAFLPAELPVNTTTIIGAAEQMPHLPADACWLVMTHDDQLDFDWIEQILLRNDARFIGLLGCRSKLAAFNLRLISRVPLGCIASVRCPLGIEGINSRQPAVMAIAIVAQLLQQCNPG